MASGQKTNGTHAATASAGGRASQCGSNGLRHSVAELSQSLAEKDEPEIYKTGEVPAIYLNFDEISLPPPAEQPQIEGLDFSSSSISEIVFDDEVKAQNTPSHPTSTSPE